MKDLPRTPGGITLVERNGILFVSYKHGGKPVTKLYKTLRGAQKHIASIEGARRLRLDVSDTGQPASTSQLTGPRVYCVKP